MFASKIILKHRIPTFLMKLTPSLTWKVKTTDKKLYLTFDDGPHPHITRWVMDCLDQYNAKATFFCVGDNVRKHPDVYAEILARGHRAGNHTFNHLSGWHTPTDTYVANTQEAAAYIQSNLFRPPYGRLTPSQIKALRPSYQLIMWDVLTCDFDKNLQTEKALDICKAITNKGSIIVFHDSEKAEENLKTMLPAYLHHFHQKGFTFETL